MRVVQFYIPDQGRRVGIVQKETVVDLTAAHSELTRIYDVFQAAQKNQISLDQQLTELSTTSGTTQISYEDLLQTAPGGSQPWLLPPVDHPDPHCLFVTGTGLTHTGSMQSRDQMHSQETEHTETHQTDSAKMFAMGVAGGKPTPGERGVSPEWFYKGNGTILRGHREPLDVPDFALDGGEEPELVGCYVIDDQGTPRRLGFVLGNEWSDHETENINYLYLAPSKLRTCSIGPELNTDFDFSDLTIRCSVQREGQTIYESGDLKTGEQFMCHSLGNCEDHHFKYPQHRQSGDVHLHFLGTSKLSHGTRDWKYQTGDEIKIEAPDFSSPLFNTVMKNENSPQKPIKVRPA
ncbi:AraD1 family protein [uncultured Gimesia sp.]|uniref:AraD1 family protein n=1 Tax=uncultured Gimesia sp. TaxID=1678688 RepID=UPI0026215213|nr:AraD1 family protein [uncultured Gimesia sp.]